MSRAARIVALAVLACAPACDFTAAFNGYCQDNPSCPSDGGASQTLEALKSCKGDQDCVPHEQICHPRGRVCIRSCTSSADCPAGEENCLDVQGGNRAGPPLMACTCSSAQSCQQAYSESTCSFSDNVCEKLCSSDADCSSFVPPRFCDQESGLCLQARCAYNSDCPSAMQPRCESGICSRCMGPLDCNQRTDGLTVCDPRGACVSP